MLQAGKADEISTARVWLKRAGIALVVLLWISTAIAFMFHPDARLPTGSRLLDVLLILAAVATLLEWGEALIGGIWTLVRLPLEKKARHHPDDDVDHGERE